MIDHHRITITTLSPVHIGCDEEFVPTNFVIKNSLLHYLDMAVLADALDTAERSTLGKMKTVGAIQQFFKSRRDRFVPLASYIIEIAEDIAREYEDKAGNPTQQGVAGESTYNMFPIARTAYRAIDFSPYLPGSSLKGSIRTAWLDTINCGKSLEQSEKADRKNANRALQQRLLEYSELKDDPLRHLQVADAHHNEEFIASPTCILYAASKKKRPSERGASELKVYLEIIPGLLDDAFVSDVRFTGNEMTWQTLCNACNAFYWPQLERELGHTHLSGILDQSWHMLINSLLANELQTLRENHQGFLLRVGRHSGAESMTLNGLRDIKILGKHGEQPTYRSETTEKRFASHTRAAADGLLPFGWVWVESCDDQFQYISAAIRDKLRPHSQPLREALRCRLNQIDEAREARLADAQAAEQKQKDAEEAERKKTHEEQARQAALAAMSPNLRKIEDLRAEIEKRLATGRKISVSDQFYGQHIAALALLALENTGWSLAEKSALADMLEKWAGKLMALDAKELRKRLKLNALRGLA